ncbi:MAG: phospholipase D-like domain-containing protein, partial [Alphaproteobacteria bacterium]|nr:phospholipase D-like domain-containing protein [Alphaproteobacteria bacterium]
PFIWAYADLAVDEPEKIKKQDSAEADDGDTVTALDNKPKEAALSGKDSASQPQSDAVSTTVDGEAETSQPVARLDRLLDNATESFTVISAYMVPRESGVEWLGKIADRGIKVRILTNSLASTDVPAVHSGYAQYRADMLRHGIELYELKSLDNKRSRQNLFGSTPRSSLHAKTYVVDGEHVVIASFNLDPRSIEDNTELALTIHSEALAQQALKMFEETTVPAKSYRLELANPENVNSDALKWMTEEKGEQVALTSEPKANWWRRIKVMLYKFLPIEDLL